MKTKEKFLLLLLFGLLLVFTGCTRNKTPRPERTCPIAQLLLDEDDYPEGSKFDTLYSPSGGDLPFESASQSAYYQASWANQWVERYTFIEDATKRYDRVRSSVFDTDDVIGVWETPSVLELGNLLADYYEIGCGAQDILGYRCYMIAQYEEYFVFYRVDIEPHGITHELYRELILLIDAEMASCLGR